MWWLLLSALAFVSAVLGYLCWANGRALRETRQSLMDVVRVQTYLIEQQAEWLKLQSAALHELSMELERIKLTLR